MRYDCIIIGGGPAGLSAALILGRCLRRVLLFDDGRQRNRNAHALHGYLTRDGIAPEDFLRLARQEVGKYSTVRLRDEVVVDATRDDTGFIVRAANGNEVRCATLLLATGVRDRIPDIEGLAELYGRSVHHCPYCDAWEWRGSPLAVYGRGDAGVPLALTLSSWSDDIVLCTDGPADIAPESQRRLSAVRVGVRHEEVARVEGKEGRLERVVFTSGESILRRALFFSTGQAQSSDLAAKLGCRFSADGVVDTGKCESTNVPGLFVCGDASKDVQFVVVAAAEGTEAAVAINQSLTELRFAPARK